MNRISELVARLEREGTADEIREDARALVAEVLAYHREGLHRMHERAPAAFAELASDPLVASLFDLHELEVARAPARPDASLVPAASLVKKKAIAQAAHSACEICGDGTAERHPHLVDVETRSMACACEPCAQTLGAGTRYRRVPADVIRVDDDHWWPALGLPTGMAFFVPRGTGVTAHYPGPAGATEGSVDRAVWAEVASKCDVLAKIEPEVQALLVNRIDGARDHWIVGVDRCWELVARVRTRWQGLTGGDEMKREVRRFFSEVAEEARP